MKVYLQVLKVKCIKNKSINFLKIKSYFLGCIFKGPHTKFV